MSIVPEISTDLVFSFYESDEEFPIDFNEAWNWLGFARKDTAKESLLNCGFTLDEDLRIDPEFLNHAGLMPQQKAAKSKLENIFLTVDCFKTWAMMANTAQGKVVRRYFLNCEKQLKVLASAKPVNQMKQLKPKVLDSLTLDELVCIQNFDGWDSTLEERVEMCPNVDPKLLYNMPEQVSEQAISAAKNKEFRAMVVKKLAKIEKICAEAAAKCDEHLLLRIKIEAQADRHASAYKDKRAKPWHLMDEPYLIDEFFLQVDESYHFESSKEHIKAAKQFESDYQKLAIAGSRLQLIGGGK